MNLAEQRQFPRYKITQQSKLKGRLGRMNRGEQLVTIGLGGCGFCMAKATEDLSAPKRVFCEFEWEETPNEPLQIQGNVLYVKPVEVGEKEVFFVGIEFLEVEREKVASLIEKIEESGEEAV